MIAKVKSGKNIKGALNYNEQKVIQGSAVCIGANGFLKDYSTLNFFEKLEMFNDLNERNLRAKTNTLHVSLNFDPSESLDGMTLNKVAATYMKEIGFGDQPYLVYQHFDAAHPHIHIVSTLIKPDGKRIPIHYLGKNQSEKARILIEKEFNLIPAKRITPKEELKVGDLSKVIYGKAEIKKNISRIVSSITNSYQYTSLAELNAVLRLYNVTADRGSEHTQMFKNGGLQYSLTNDNGEKVGIPIKASSLSGRPTLKYLEKKFDVNNIKRVPFKDPLKRIIDAALTKASIKTLTDFKDIMNSQGVRVIYRVNEQSLIFGVTFVDTNRKTVFNGSSLGKSYGAKAIIEKLSARHEQVSPQSISSPNLKAPLESQEHESVQSLSELRAARLTEGIELLMLPTGIDGTTPDHAMKLRKKKRRKKK